MNDAEGSAPGDEPSPIPPEEVRRHREHDHIVAVFTTREDAEAAVAELQSLGLGSEHLGIAVHGPEHVAFEHDEAAEMGHDIAAGVASGVPAGFLAGLALASLTIPGVGVLGVGGILAIGAASGFGGAMLGGFFGVAAGDRAISEHDDIAHLPLNEGEVLVAVCSHGHPDMVQRTLARHRGRLVP